MLRDGARRMESPQFPSANVLLGIWLLGGWVAFAVCCTPNPPGPGSSFCGFIFSTFTAWDQPALFAAWSILLPSIFLMFFSKYRQQCYNWILLAKHPGVAWFISKCVEGIIIKVINQWTCVGLVQLMSRHISFVLAAMIYGNLQGETSKWINLSTCSFLWILFYLIYCKAPFFCTCFQPCTWPS